MHTDYDPATGRATPTSTTDGSGTSTIIRGYDTLGRLTSLSDSAAGTFTARYDADGQLTTQGYPGGLEARTSYDPTGSPAELAYVKTSNRTTQCTWLDFQATPSIHGQILDQASSLSTQDLTYDAAGRLTQAQDTPVGTGCTIRGYGYDPDSNRTSLTTNPPAADGTCDQAAAGTTGSHAYDAADRLTDPGFAYDPFGRSTTVPAAAAGTASDVTAGYYASDMVRSLTQGSTTHTWTLDPGGRPRTRTDTGGATGTRTNHYADDTDSPAWVAETADGAHWTRDIAGIGGDLAAVQDSAAGTTLQLADLHGDTVATASPDPAAPGLLSTFGAGEFGVPRSGPGPRYGWLGAKQRETDDLTGVMLMGVRLYVPMMGRFLQVDPVEGGSANDYDYAGQDPINDYDLNGALCFIKCGWARWTRTAVTTPRRVAHWANQRAYDVPGWGLYQVSRLGHHRSYRCGPRTRCVEHAWFMRRGYGFTLGHHIFFGGRASRSQIIHERTHVHQFEHYGWTFGFRYAWSSAACRCYRNNIYERRAYYNQRVGRFHYRY